ncbi:MAG TPA: DUF2380 domain-containing protein [Myxococcus sp.]|nr:DUF2380 domain-containing protein [Myxococcus sp.]
MRAEALVLLSAGLLSVGCASVTPVPGREGRLGYTPHAPAGSASRESPPRPSASRPLSAGEAGRSRAEVARTRQAVREAVGGVKDSLEGVSRSLESLAARTQGIGGVRGVFIRYVTYGSHEVPWIDGALGSAASLSEVASDVEDADMELALLRMTGPRLQAALFGATLLAAWVDFLTLADVVLKQCPAYSVERLFMDMRRVQGRVAPAMAELASLEPARVEAAAAAMPALMGELTREFHSIRGDARVAMEHQGRAIAVAQFVEMLTMVSVMKLTLPRLPPAAPVTVGVGLVMGSGGVMAGSRLVVSAEWVERVRRLVQAGVISMPAVSAAVRIHAGQVMMAQANGDLPKAVRDALGDSPEVRGMHETGRAGAGMAEPPKHHVLPREHREWFQKRGFTGDMDIDQFCVRLEPAHHQAIHGGGDWRLGRTWPGEWNRMIMKALHDLEIKAGRTLTRDEILRLVATNMRDYRIPMTFTPWRGR